MPDVITIKKVEIAVYCIFHIEQIINASVNYLNTGKDLN